MWKCPLPFFPKSYTCKCAGAQLRLANAFFAAFSGFIRARWRLLDIFSIGLLRPLQSRMTSVPLGSGIRYSRPYQGRIQSSNLLEGWWSPYSTNGDLVFSVVPLHLLLTSLTVGSHISAYSSELRRPVVTQVNFSFWLDGAQRPSAIKLDTRKNRIQR